MSIDIPARSRRRCTGAPSRRGQNRSRVGAGARGAPPSPWSMARADARQLRVAPPDHLGTGTGEGPSWDEVEETLIAGDVGAALAIDLVDGRADGRPSDRRGSHPDRVGGATRCPRSRLEPAVGGRRRSGGRPLVGVNGTGKTTTIGKLASRYTAEGGRCCSPPRTLPRRRHRPAPHLGRASQCPDGRPCAGADPGAVVYDALDAAVARSADLVIADTAGWRHTRRTSWTS